MGFESETEKDTFWIEDPFGPFSPPHHLVASPKTPLSACPDYSKDDQYATLPQNMVSSDSTEEISAARIHQEIDRIVAALAKRHENEDALVVVGIANGGIQLAQRLAEHLSRILSRAIQCGVVDITFHRDDISIRPITKISISTELEFPVDGSTVILVDDVLHSGRTVRAAINELFDQGRPETIELVALVERDGRKLPLRADYRGEFDTLLSDAAISVRLDNSNPQNDRIQFVPTQL